MGSAAFFSPKIEGLRIIEYFEFTATKITKIPNYKPSGFSLKLCLNVK